MARALACAPTILHRRYISISVGAPSALAAVYRRLSRRFSALAVFDARLYIQVRHIDEPA